MGKAQLECPNCQGTVTLGEVTCPHCGINLKSGESYEEQVKRAKGKSKHQDAYSRGLYVGIVLALAVCLFAGYMYQRRVEKVLADRSSLFAPLIERLQNVRDLADAGKYADARQSGEALLTDLQNAYNAVKPGQPFDITQLGGVYDQPVGSKKTRGDEGSMKRLLGNMMAKTNYILKHLPAS